jgi:putative ABC transport system permease protein
MLTRIFHDPIQLAAAQAAVAGLMAIAVVFVARLGNIRMEKEVIIALVRALIQVVAVGSILLLIFKSTVIVGFVILAIMMVLAALTASRRARQIPGVFQASLYGIAIGAGTTIVLMTWAGVIDTRLTALIPVGSMIVANGMNTTSLALERFRREIEAHSGIIETALSLGAEPKTTVAPYMSEAVKASLIPRVDSLRSLGIIWIPGVMTGMLLAGNQPVHAALYQFVIMAMIFSVSGLSSLLATIFVSMKVFSPAEQLILHGEGN